LTPAAASVATVKTAYNLRQQLESFVSGRCSALAFVHGLSAFCRAEPEAAWDALSLIDQYHRRGKISVDVYRTISQGIERRLLGRQGSNAGSKRVPRADVYAETVATVPGMLGKLEMQRQLMVESESAAEVPASNTGLTRARGQLQRYQNGRAMLGKIDRRNRGALATALRELKISGAQAADYLEQLTCDRSRRYEGTSSAGKSDTLQERRDGYRRPWQARLPLAVCLVALVPSMGAWLGR
jgi:hypothetical protein